MDTAVKLIDTEDGAVRVGGYGVCWGGVDLCGDHFTAGTDFWFDRLTETPPVLYAHGMNAGTKKAVIGRVVAKTVDETGLWIEAELDKSRRYLEEIRKLISAGALGWSSGSVGHLVEIMQPSREIVTWPIAEFSLTPSPAEPRTLGVLELASLTKSLDRDMAEHIAGLKEAVDGLDDAIKATWSTAQVNDFPDSSFAIVLSGGEKDEDGKTTPRALRKLPHHDGSGKIDLPHLRNSLARAPQMTGVSDAQRNRAVSHLRAHAKAEGVGEATERSVREMDVVMVREHIAAVRDLMEDTPDGDLDREVVAVMAKHIDAMGKALGEDDGSSVPEREQEDVEATLPLSERAGRIVNLASTLHERTEDLVERRAKESRILSAANRRRIENAMGAMDAVMGDFKALLAETEPAARAVDIAWLATELELLKLQAEPLLV